MIMPVYGNLRKLKQAGLKKSTLITYNMLLRKIDIVQKRTKLLSKPTSLQLEPTTKCNIKCRMCISPFWDRKGMDMDFSDFKKIIDQFPYLVDLLMQGIGEPLLCEDFFRMVSYCKSKKIMVAITTNGTLIDKDMARQLVESKLDGLIVSLDGIKPETFEKTRIGSKLDQVINNIKNVVEARGILKRPRIVILFTANSENIEELPGVLRLAKNLGIDDVEAQDTHFWGDEIHKSRLINETLYSSKIDRAKEIVNETIEESKKLGIPFYWLGARGRNKPYTDSDRQLHGNPRDCKKVFRSCFITVDGFVTSCACVPDPRTLNFGNILQQDFDEIWNSPKYVAYRKERLEGKVPEVCKMCTVPTL